MKHLVSRAPGFAQFSRVLAAAAVLFSTTAALPAAGPQLLRGHVPAAVAGSRVVERLPGEERLNLAIGLPLRNREELDKLLRQLYDPASPNYHRYLKPEQFAERFGPSESDYAELIEFARSTGLKVSGTHPNRMILDVTGSAADIERALRVHLSIYNDPVRGRFYAPDAEPTLDLDVPVLQIGGLDNFVVPRPMDLAARPLALGSLLTTGSGPWGLFIGGDFRAAYANGVTLNGSGQTVGLFELDGFYASDVAANFQAAGLPPVPTQTVLLDGFSGAPGGNNLEVILDIMMAAYMAPGLSKVIIYEGYTPNDVLNRMATDNLAAQLSCSWGFGPLDATTEQIFLQYQAQGQSFFQASGDSGAWPGWVMPPCDDPNVTSVGGTSLTTAGPGGAWQSETTWPKSGGGISDTYPIPSYQQGLPPSSGASSVWRSIPDVALTADIQMYMIWNGGQVVSVGGTSAAAPLWAGFLALANQQAALGGKPPIGFLNPLLYAIGAGSSYQTDLHDITTGSNGYPAIAGYDLSTGWGTPAGQPLIDELAGHVTTPYFNLSAAPYLIRLVPGGSGSDSTITVFPQNGFNGAVGLTASGLPGGVTASFSPATTAGTSILTLTASASALPGTASVTITGVSGNLSSTTVISLAVTGPPSFTLQAFPASLSVQRGSSSAGAIIVAAQNGFSGSVSLAASGLPSGVAASFSPAITPGSSMLTIAANGAATLGTFAITVKGTSGIQSQTTIVMLGVLSPLPNFTLSAAPASLTVQQGSNAAAVITINRHNGFTGMVSLTAFGLPEGFMAALSPAGTNGTSILTVTATSSAVTGLAVVTVSGVSGSVRSALAIPITVTGAPNFTLSASALNVRVVRGGFGGATTITVNWLPGASGIVALTATGLPSGITAMFNPASTATSAMLALFASSSAATGTVVVTVTGAVGSLKSSLNITLVVELPPTFALSATPNRLTLKGPPVATNILLNPQNGFSGSVTLTVTGLPHGVSASLTPAQTGGITLTVSAANTAAAGIWTITVTGTSGSIVSSVAISLTVTAAVAPNFSLSALPATLGVLRGSSGRSVIVVTPVNGFNGVVKASIIGLPAGVTASFAPSGVGLSLTLTLSAKLAALKGKFTLTVTGSCSVVSHTTTVTLTVV